MEAIILKSASFADRFNEYATFVLRDGYLYDQENKEAVKSCIDVLEKSETGLFIIGNPGSGKTLLFEMAQKVINPTSENRFTKVSVLEVVQQFNNKEIGHGVFRKWADKNVFFDDLGTETKGYLFGEKIEVFEKFIQFRYDLFRASKIKTHFTSNLSYNDLKERYGMRCISRLSEMCTVVMMGNKADYTDRRSYKNFIGLPPVIHEKILSKEEKEWLDGYEQMKKEAQENPQPSERKGLGQRFKEQFNRK